MLADPGTLWNYGRSVDVQGRRDRGGDGQNLRCRALKRADLPAACHEGHGFLSFDRSRQQAVWRRPIAAACIDPTQRRAMMFGTNGPASTTSDYLRFTMMIAGGGKLDGVRILKPETARADDHRPAGSAAWIAPPSPTARRAASAADSACKPEGAGGPHATHGVDLGPARMARTSGWTRRAASSPYS